MAATVTTKEPVTDDVTEEQLEAEKTLRIQAGAIRSYVERVDGKRLLCTEWNVIGQND